MLFCLKKESYLYQQLANLQLRLNKAGIVLSSVNRVIVADPGSTLIVLRHNYLMMKLIKP